MRKILLFAADIVPIGNLPTSGGGVRSWQLAKSIEDLGHEVILSIPSFTYLAKKFPERVPEELLENAWELGTQDALIRKHRPDVVLFACSWIVDRTVEEHDVVRIYDLNGPQLLEMCSKGHFEGPASIDAKVRRLAQSDFVICGGHRQRNYFLPFLMLAGHKVDTPETLQVVPVCIPATPPKRMASKSIHLLVAGGFYPWQDPSPTFDAITPLLRRRPDIRMTILGKSHGVNGVDDRAYESVREQLRELPNVRFVDFVGWDELIEVERSATVAIELHRRTTERELAVTTRTINYLWSGLPVIYNDYSELSDEIKRFEAGWTLDPADANMLPQAMEWILSEPEEIERRAKQTRELTEALHDWRSAIAPLEKFLEAPRRRKRLPASSIVDVDRLASLLQSEQRANEMEKSRAVAVAKSVSAFRQRWLGAGP